MAQAACAPFKPTPVLLGVGKGQEDEGKVCSRALGCKAPSGPSRLTVVHRVYHDRMAEEKILLSHVASRLVGAHAGFPGRWQPSASERIFDRVDR